MEGDRATTYLDNSTTKAILRGTALEITKSYYEMASDLVNVVRMSIAMKHQISCFQIPNIGKVMT